MGDFTLSKKGDTMLSLANMLYHTTPAIEKILWIAAMYDQESVRISCGENGIIPLAIRDEVISHINSVGRKVSGVVGSDDITVWLKGK